MLNELPKKKIMSANNNTRYAYKIIIYHRNKSFKPRGRTERENTIDTPEKYSLPISKTIGSPTNLDDETDIKSNSCLMLGRFRAKSIINEFKRLVSAQTKDRMDKTLVRLQRQQNQCQNIQNKLSDINYDKVKHTKLKHPENKPSLPNCNSRYRFNKSATIIEKVLLKPKQKKFNKASKRILNK